MSPAISNLLLGSILCLALPRAAQAQRRPSPAVVGEAPATALPDALFVAVGDRPVVLQLTDGREVEARILAVEPAQLVISVLASGQVRILPRASVTTVRLPPVTPMASPAVDREAAATPAAPWRNRHLAINAAIAPSIDLDLDAGLFHGFANVGLVLPLATQGQLMPFSLGMGISLPRARKRPTFTADLFVHFNVVADAYSKNLGSRAWLGLGVGLGFHYTYNNGLTLGMALPLVGYSVPARGSPDGLTGVTYYYLTSFEALPLFYCGYRM